MNNLAFLFSMFWKIIFITFFFGLCIFVHEFGHLLASLWRGLHVEKFSIGFGKRIWGFTIGKVEYVVSLLPFGGYVMLPQLDPTDRPLTSDGKELPFSSPGDRIAAAFAGPFLNVIFGFFLASIMWMVGVGEPAPAHSCIVTEVPQVLPLYNQGLKLSDRVIAVDGEPVEGYWDDICATLSTEREELKLTVLRSGEKHEIPYRTEPNPEWLAGLRPGQRIIAVNDKPFKKGVEEMTTEYVFSKKAEVKLTVLDNEGMQRDISLKPAPNPLMENLGFPFFHAVNPLSIGGIIPGSIAEQAGLKPGDQLLELNGKALDTSSSLLKLLQEEADAKNLTIRLNRQGKELLFEDLPMPAAPRASALGIAFNVRAEMPLPGMPAKEAGVQHGDILVSIDSTDVSDVGTFIDKIKNSEGRSMELAVLRDGKLLNLKIQPALNQVEGQSVYQIGLKLSGEAGKIIGHPSPWRQFTSVVEQTGRTLQLLFAPLVGKVKSLSGAQSAERPASNIQVRHMSGPLGIIMMLWYKLKLEGLRGGFSFIILITFSLAIINLLPLPILDGGHIVYALLELIFRRRLPTKLVAILQNTFAALLIGLMLYITAFDGKRLMQRLSFGRQSHKIAEEMKQEIPEEAPATPEAETELELQNGQ